MKKKTLLIVGIAAIVIIAIILLIVLLPKGSDKPNGETENTVSEDVVELLIEEGNRLAAAGKTEAAKLVLERATQITDDRIKSGGYVGKDYCDFLSDDAKKIIASCELGQSLLGEDGKAPEVPKHPDVDWGD